MFNKTILLLLFFSYISVMYHDIVPHQHLGMDFNKQVAHFHHGPHDQGGQGQQGSNCGHTENNSGQAKQCKLYHSNCCSGDFCSHLIINSMIALPQEGFAFGQDDYPGNAHADQLSTDTFSVYEKSPYQNICAFVEPFRERPFKGSLSMRAPPIS
jgi:hypothetical protein